MTNMVTHRALRVLDGGEAGPYLRLPLSQLTTVCQILDRSRLSYWVDDEAISLDGRPPIIVVNFSKQVDGATVQGILDDAP